MLEFLEHGGRRAMLSTVAHSARWAAGTYGQFRRVEWGRVGRLVFVCKGNICRSAFADRLSRNNADGLDVASAGLAATTGTPADNRAQSIARLRGVSLEAHRSTHIDEIALSARDLLVAFEPEHAHELARRAAAAGNAPQVTLLGLWSPASWRVYIHDPYGLSELYFQRCFERIEAGVAGLLDARRNSLPASAEVAR